MCQFSATHPCSRKSYSGKYSRFHRKIPVLEPLFRVVSLRVSLLKKWLRVIAVQAFVSFDALGMKKNIEHLNQY